MKYIVNRNNEIGYVHFNDSENKLENVMKMKLENLFYQKRRNTKNGQ